MKHPVEPVRDPCATCGFTPPPPLDRTDAASVDLGRTGPEIRLPLAAKEFALLAPLSALEDVMAWLRAQHGTRGKRELPLVVVTEDGWWTELNVQPPIRKHRRARKARALELEAAE